MLPSIKCNLNLTPETKAYLNKIFSKAVSGEIKSHAAYVDTYSVNVVSKDQALCMYDYADILLKED